MTSPRLTATYSMLTTYGDCPMKGDLRYGQQLVPQASDPNLSFGSVFHGCLKLWHEHHDLSRVLDFIDRSYPNRAGDDDQRRDWHLATAMMRAYVERYPSEDFEVIALEKPIDGPIINPATGATSRTFHFAGKVDGIIRLGDEHLILEHKTAGSLDGGYLERLWSDFQTTLYAHYVEKALGVRVAGVLYNVIVKARLQQSQGETEEEFEARRAALIAKSKTGKSSAKRRMPESDEAFQARLAEKYLDPGMFHREHLIISRDRFQALRSHLWEMTQMLLHFRRRGVYPQNPAHCFRYGRPCAYHPLCSSDFSPAVRENLYRIEPPHSELTDDESDPHDKPVF
ncbi:MAG TPA: PD-(D/E)XK nuclease family protein [bacterium]|nr:PD-(D/E)XK nuclease family protein [bacterium]